jgi:hypothetical protein
MSNLTSSPSGISPSAARTQEATRRVALIHENAVKMADWWKLRRITARRELNVASTYQITDKFAQLNRKLEFMDAAKAHLISAIAAENYTKDFRSQELTESVATL